MSESWLVRADTGGTFTDAWARSPQGEERRCKVLSSGVLRGRVGVFLEGGWFVLNEMSAFPDGFLCGWKLGAGTVIEHQAGKVRLSGETVQEGEVFELATGEEAPVVAARVLTQTPLGTPFPEMDFRVATTRGTNALLEGKGREPVLFVTAGFEGLLEIRDQRRPELFARSIQKSAPITRKRVDIAGRVSVDGEILRPFDEVSFRKTAEALYAKGERVAVVALLHGDRFGEMEMRACEILREIGFEEVTASGELGLRIGYLARMETAVANGYLGPVMNSFKRGVSAAGEVSLLTSAGGLQSVADYEPVDSLLSGPAGGLVGALAVARAAGYERVLTFDMGGTSTDVARLEGRIPLRYEQAIGPVRVRRPGVRMETVAAGGGSICQWRNGGLQVGPESAGAEPGPACYGLGGPLTVTDVNLLLGHFEEGRMGIPLDRAAAELRLQELLQELLEAGETMGEQELLLGLRAIAVERMAEAVRAISVGEGFEVADYTLVAFGGAGPQHACDLAESLGVSRVLVPGDAGLLSAWGLHRAQREAMAERQILQGVEELREGWSSLGDALEEEALAGVIGGKVARWLIEVRLRGQDSTIEIEGGCFPSLQGLLDGFAERYLALFGYAMPLGRELEVVMARVVAREPGAEDEGEEFGPAEEAIGLISAEYCTVLLGVGWSLRRGTRGSLLLEGQGHQKAVQRGGAVGAELMRARFESVATSMGELLRRTALSTNVKERLDFSCAVLDREGRLVVNAPHIPVHLGALGVCVRQVTEERCWRRGDMVVVNHPGFGGSHLPDVTVVSPVFSATGALLAFVANRAHHAEIGGKSPGSMPGDARNLEEEGVVIAPRLLFDEGRECFAEIEAVLREARFPSRGVSENLADLRAQAAANHAGVHALQELLAEFGEQELVGGMAALSQRAAGVMAKRLQQLGSGTLTAEGALDDGTPVRVTLGMRAGRLRIDFAGSGAVHAGNLNATEGVTRSAVLYALRLWVDEDLPLNEGLLAAVEIVAEGTFLHPRFPENAAACPAVVGGNVETSQRIVEVVLRALGLGAESQGTMNNFLFGNERFGYYETIGGGAGAGEGTPGASGVHVHMTNTSITDPEVLEYRFPVRLHRFSLRRESGGAGQWSGGDGLVREVEFLEPMTVTFLTQSRQSGPRGAEGGQPGAPGRQFLWRSGNWHPLPGITTFDLAAGERVLIETPGGGGYRSP